MSYHIVQKIKIDDNKVLVISAANNLYPHTPHEWQSSYLEKWQENGYPSLDIAILSAYESGNFQPGRPNKYTRALEVLRKMPEYTEFNGQKEFYDLMARALVTRRPKKL